jgi:hypothetical protein
MTEFKALEAIADQLDRIGTRNQLYYKFNYRQTFSHTDAKKYTTTTRAHPNQVHPRAVSRHAITIPTRAITLQQDQPQYLHQKHFLTFGKIFENKDPNFFFGKFAKIFYFYICALYFVLFGPLRCLCSYFPTLITKNLTFRPIWNKLIQKYFWKISKKIPYFDMYLRVVFSVVWFGLWFRNLCWFNSSVAPFWGGFKGLELNSVLIGAPASNWWIIWFVSWELTTASSRRELR